MDKPITKPKVNYRAIGAFVVAIVFVVFAVLAPTQNTIYSVNGEHIIVSEVRRGLYEDYIPLRVHVEPYKTVYLDAIEGGRVEALSVEEGALVEKGQLLVSLSNTSLQLDIISREAQVSEQINNLRNTKLAIERNRLSLKQDLIELDYQTLRLRQRLERRAKVSDYVGEEELQTIKDELAYYMARRKVTLESQQQEEKLRVVQIEQLEESVSQLERNLVIARKNLDHLNVRAPRAGRLTSFNIDVGETKNRGERLGQIDDVNRFKASGKVSEFYLNRLAIGQLAEVTIDNEGYEMELAKIYPEVRNNEFEVDLKFVGSSPKKIRRGQTLTPRLMLSEREEVLLIDNGSFMQSSGGAWVFVLNKNRNNAIKREVLLGRRNPNQIEVKQGLLVGEQVLVSSYSSFKDVEEINIK